MEILAKDRSTSENSFQRINEFRLTMKYDDNVDNFLTKR